MLPYSLVTAKDQRTNINQRNRNVWWNAHLMHVRFRKGKLVAGTVMWDDKIGGKDKVVELPWDHIEPISQCGRGKRNKTTTNFYTTNLVQNNKFNSVLRERTGWAAYMQQIYKFSQGVTNDYGDAFARLDDESIMNIIETCNDELGKIFLVLVNKPMIVRGDIKN